MALTIKNYLTDKELQQALQLDADSYDENIQIDDSLCKEWLSVNPDIYTVLNDGEKLAGYINFTPLKEQSYENYRAGKINDTDLRAADLLNFADGREKPLNCLFMSIAVSKEYTEHNMRSFETLMAALDKRLADYRDNGVKFGRVLCDIINPKLAHLVEKLGYTKIGHIGAADGELYEGDLSNGFSFIKRKNAVLTIPKARNTVSAAELTPDPRRQ
jgi:hypothetical protein